MNPSEEHCEVDCDEDLELVEYGGPNELDSREVEACEDKSDSAVDRVSESLCPEVQAGLFFGSCAALNHCDLSSALRTFSTVHTLSSWLEGVGLEVVPGRLSVNSKDWSFTSSMLSEVVSRSDESP